MWWNFWMPMRVRPPLPSSPNCWKARWFCLYVVPSSLFPTRVRLKVAEDPERSGWIHSIQLYSTYQHIMSILQIPYFPFALCGHLAESCGPMLLSDGYGDADCGNCCPGGTLQSLLLDRENLLEEEPMGDSIHSKNVNPKKPCRAVPFFLKVILQGIQNPLNPCRHQYCHILGGKQVERCWKWLLRLYQFVKTWKKQSVWTQRACNKAERLTQGHFIPKLLCCSWMVLRDFRNMFAGAAETKSCNIVFRFSLNFESLLSVPKVHCKCLFSHALNWSLARRKLYQLPNKCS